MSDINKEFNNPTRDTTNNSLNSLQETPGTATAEASSAAAAVSMSSLSSEEMIDLQKAFLALKEEKKMLMERIATQEKNQEMQLKKLDKLEVEQRQLKNNIEEEIKSNDQAAAASSSQPFNSLPDDILYKILEFEGKTSFAVYARINKQCKAIFDLYQIPKKSYLYAYGSLAMIQQSNASFNKNDIALGIAMYDRKDVLEWVLRDLQHDRESLYWICVQAIKFTRVDIIEEVFEKSNEAAVNYLQRLGSYLLCNQAARYGNLKSFMKLRKLGCKCDEMTYKWAKQNKNRQILCYLNINPVVGETG